MKIYVHCNKWKYNIKEVAIDIKGLQNELFQRFFG